MKIEFTPEFLAQAAQWCFEAQKMAADAQSKADSLKEHGKDLLELLKTKQDNGTAKMSESKLERLARSTKDWQEFREGEQAANQDAIIKKAKVTSARMLWETVQSGLSYKKEEMRRLGG